MAMLYEYCKNGMLREARNLIEAGEPANGHRADDGTTSLLQSARCGHGAVVDMLLAYGADAQARTTDGSTALHHAAKGGCLQVAKSLIAAGVDLNVPDQDGATAIFVAVSKRSLAMVRLFCEHGADINAKADGWTPLSVAEGEVAAFLESLGAKHGRKHVAIAEAVLYEYSRRGMLREVRNLLELGEPADGYFADDGSTGLVIAARCGHGAVVDLLLKHGANAMVRTQDGSTVLHHAVSGGSPQALSALIATGVDVNQPSVEGITPLLMAVEQKSLVMVRLLCDGGANINADAESRALLDCAESEVVAFLGSFGAARLRTSADLPVDKGLPDVAECVSYVQTEAHVAGEDAHSLPMEVKSEAAECVSSAESVAEEVGEVAPSLLMEAFPEEEEEVSAAPSEAEPRPMVGDFVTLRKPKDGLLQERDVGEVVGDDGSDFLPLKVAFREGHRYYNPADVMETLMMWSAAPEAETTFDPDASNDWWTSDADADIDGDYDATDVMESLEMWSATAEQTLDVRPSPVSLVSGLVWPALKKEWPSLVSQRSEAAPRVLGA